VSVKVDMKRFGLVNDDDSHNQDKWRSLTTGNHPTLSHCGTEGVSFTDYIPVTLNVNE